VYGGKLLVLGFLIVILIITIEMNCEWHFYIYVVISSVREVELRHFELFNPFAFLVFLFAAQLYLCKTKWQIQPAEGRKTVRHVYQQWHAG
jgi:hypothetical protein